MQATGYTIKRTTMNTSKIAVVLIMLAAVATGRSLLAEKDNTPACLPSSNNVVSLAVRGNGSDTAARCSGSPITQLTNTRITASQLKNMESVEAAKMLQAALGAVPDYITLVKTAITDFCWVNSGAGCDIDLDGTTDWYKRYFASHTPLTTDSDTTPITLNNDTYPYKSTYRKFACQYNPVSPQDCSMSGQTITTNSVQETHTQTYSYQAKVGFVVKIKGGGNEGTWEQTFDFGYSQSSGEATTKLSGETTVAGVKVPMEPSDKQCVVIEIILQRVKQTGNMVVWVRSQGWIGTHQSDSHRWVHVDSDINESHYAQELNLPSAKKWTVKNDGAYMTTPFTLTFDVANTGYANPQMYDKDDTRCTQT